MNDKILKFFVLPSERTATELAHVRRVNKVALGVCLAHIPLFLLVAYLCGTSMVQALVYGALLVAGPGIATATIKDPRQLSLIYGFTSMGLGALLVHLGQGPMQIEMHFHFFAALALLTVWGNPLIIWVAALTVAVHHGAFWFFLPKSVFNYDASFWVVAVHAAFVVVESIAAAFIARNFFDNVIGLEKIITSRTAQLNDRNRQMKLILDHTAQGFLTLGMDGLIADERSAFVEAQFGPIGAKTTFWKYLSHHDSEFAGLAEFAFNDLTEGTLPLDYCLASLPGKLQLGGKVFQFQYTAILSGDVLQGLLVVASDITVAIESARAAAQQAEMIVVFSSVMADRYGFLEFLEQTGKTVDLVASQHENGWQTELARAVHTIKGNCSVYGLLNLASVCHDIETRSAEAGGSLSALDAKRLVKEWEELRTRVASLLEGPTRSIDVDPDELDKAVAALRTGSNPNAVASELDSWRHEPTQRRLSRMAAQAKAVAQRLGKDCVEVVVEDNHLRLPQAEWASFWSVLPHVIRNALDHGLEAPAVRQQLGKIEPARLTLATRSESGRIVITVADNGGGIQWDTLKKKGAERGLPTATRSDLLELIYTDGISAKDTVTHDSGRGVGMAAVRKVCQQMGGSIELLSEASVGTTFVFSFPSRPVLLRKAA